MKKVFVSLVLAALVGGGVFAQDNWVSGTVSLIGIGVQYERVLTPNFSVGGSAYWNSLFFFWNNTGVKVFGRYYPWESSFYAEVGLGYGYRTGFEDITVGGYAIGDDVEVGRTGILLEPGVGWKIDVGGKGGFFIEPAVSVPIVIGKTDYASSYGKKNDIGIGATLYTRISFGYAF